MIQLLTYSGKEEGCRGAEIALNSMHDPQSLDEYDVNVISLQDECLWRNNAASRKRINASDDLKSLSEMIRSSKKTRIVILFPQNYVFKYNMPNYDKRFRDTCEIKNMLEPLNKDIINALFDKTKKVQLIYENNKTILKERTPDERTVSSSFFFNELSDGRELTTSISNKITTIEVDRVILSTLELNSYSDIMTFLDDIDIYHPEQKAPDWIYAMNMFDDVKQREIIQENKEHIDYYTNIINKANEILSQNLRFKSILYTNGKELVSVVFDILQEMLGCNLSDFKDVKKEDFRFKIGQKVFIGEIKGIRKNVQRSNISQLFNHVQEYLDENNEDKNNIIALLIIDHQRDKPIEKRAKVPDDQIELAKRNGCLIVETMTLLKLFEQYRLKERSQDSCISILEEQTGILDLDKETD